MFERFSYNNIGSQIDVQALHNTMNGDKRIQHLYLITNTSLELQHFTKLNTIDEIDPNQISCSVFFLHFISDDEYLYHLDKIIKNQGKFVIQKVYAKNLFVHSSRMCRLALTDTLRRKDDISHFTEIIHGNICQALEQTKRLDGDYVEIGVYKGGSALTALNYMKHANIKRKSYFLDTYDGFNYTEADASSETHWNNQNNHHRLYGTDKTMEYIQKILSEECPEQEFSLIKSNICSQELPSSIQHIAVANLDVDLYDATRDGLNKLAPKIVKGGIIIAEDPTSTPGLIGAFYAMETFLETTLGKQFMKLHLSGQYFLIRME